MNVRFLCPQCETSAKITLPGGDAAAAEQPACYWRCPACDYRLETVGDADKARVSQCYICGIQELFKRKDFPHGLGLTILVIACAASFYTYYGYEKWLTWAILIGTAVFDGLLYLLVGDVIVCYRCNAQYRGLPRGSEHEPFDLGIAERYRQERIRREQLDAENSSEHKASSP